MFDLPAIQAAIREQGLDGWLLYDFRGTNVLAQRIAGLDEKKLSRRWFYFVPAAAEPRKLVHAIEPAFSGRAARHAKNGLPPLAGTGGRRRQNPGARQAHRHGVFAPQRQPVCRPRGCRHH